VARSPKTPDAREKIIIFSKTLQCLKYTLSIKNINFCHFKFGLDIFKNSKKVSTFLFTYFFLTISIDIHFFSVSHYYHLLASSTHSPRSICSVAALIGVITNAQIKYLIKYGCHYAACYKSLVVQVVFW